MRVTGGVFVKDSEFLPLSIRSTESVMEKKMDGTFDNPAFDASEGYQGRWQSE